MRAWRPRAGSSGWTWTHGRSGQFHQAHQLGFHLLVLTTPSQAVAAGGTAWWGDSTQECVSCSIHSFMHACVHSFNSDDRVRHAVFRLLGLTSHLITALAAVPGKTGSVTACNRQGPRKSRNKLPSRNTFWKLRGASPLSGGEEAWPARRSGLRPPK